MSIRSPLARARRLGSAQSGVSHWWAQRISAVALVPLTVWFVVSLATHMGGGYDAAIAWLSSPIVAPVLAVYIAVLFYHSQLGLQVIIEDYVHVEWLKLGLVSLLQLANVAVAVAAIFSIGWIVLGGGR